MISIWFLYFFFIAVDAFKPDLISETILRRLLKQDIIHHIKYRGRERQKNDPLLIIYEQGKAVREIDLKYYYH